MTSLYSSESLPLSVSEATQAIDEHQRQVNSVVSELTLNDELAQLTQCAAQLHQHIHVRFACI